MGLVGHLADAMGEGHEDFSAGVPVFRKHTLGGGDKTSGCGMISEERGVFGGKEQPGAQGGSWMGGGARGWESLLPQSHMSLLPPSTPPDACL